MLPTILSRRLYYVRTGNERGSINLVPGCEKAKYLLLHNGQNRMLLPLDGNGPRYFNAQTLREMGFSPTGFHYLGFSLNPTHRLPPSTLPTCPAADSTPPPTSPPSKSCNAPTLRQKSKKYIDYIFRNKTVTKNIGKSVRTRLLNLAKEEKILFL